jgi:hypothetical protein
VCRRDYVDYRFSNEKFCILQKTFNEFELIFYSQQLITEIQAATARFVIFARIINSSFGLKAKLNQGFEDELNFASSGIKNQQGFKNPITKKKNLSAGRLTN